MINILGIDHVCISSNKIENDSKKIIKLGYELLFNEYELPISNKKKEFLKKNPTTHNLSFLNSPTCISIELIDHYEFSNNNSTYNLVFDIPKTIDLDFQIMEKDFLCDLLEFELQSKISKKHIPDLQLSFYEKQTEQLHGLSMIVINYINLEKASKFWCKFFGFKKIKSSIFHGIKYELLSFLAPVKQWSVNLLLVEGKHHSTISYLDDYGCTCISFLVSSIEDCLKSLRDLDSICVGNSYDINVGGKEISLVFLRGLENEIIELIEIKREK